MIASVASYRSLERTRTTRAVMPAPPSPILADRPPPPPAEAAVVCLATRAILDDAAMAALIQLQADLA